MRQIRIPDSRRCGPMRPSLRTVGSDVSVTSLLQGSGRTAESFGGGLSPEGTPNAPSPCYGIHYTTARPKCLLAFGLHTLHIETAGRINDGLDVRPSTDASGPGPSCSKRFLRGGVTVAPTCSHAQPQSHVQDIPIGGCDTRISGETAEGFLKSSARGATASLHHTWAGRFAAPALPCSGSGPQCPPRHDIALPCAHVHHRSAGSIDIQIRPEYFCQHWRLWGWLFLGGNPHHSTIGRDSSVLCPSTSSVWVNGYGLIPS